MIPHWLLLSLLAAIGYGISPVITTGAIGEGGIGATAWTICTHIIGAILFGIVLMLPLPAGLSKNGIRDVKRSVNEFLPIVVLIALLFWIGDVAINASYSRSPNPGYCDTVSDLESVIGALFALVLFKAPLTERQMVGMTVAVFSLYFLQL